MDEQPEIQGIDLALYRQVLRGRREELGRELQRIADMRDALTRQEARILQQVRSLDALLTMELDGGDLGIPAELRASEVAGDDTHGAGATDAPGSGATAVHQGVASDPALAPRDVRDLVLDAVQQVLRQEGVPLHYRQLADTVGTQAPLRGKDPGATLLAHLSRAADRFVRVGRGIYWLADEPLPAGILVAAGGRRRARRGRRTRRSA